MPEQKRDEIFNLVLKLLKKKLNRKFEIKLSTKFTDLEIDSLDLMDMIIVAEKKWNVTISNDDLMSIKTVNDLVTVLEKLL